MRLIILLGIIPSTSGFMWNLLGSCSCPSIPICPPQPMCLPAPALVCPPVTGCAGGGSGYFSALGIGAPYGGVGSGGVYSSLPSFSMVSPSYAGNTGFMTNNIAQLPQLQYISSLQPAPSVQQSYGSQAYFNSPSSYSPQPFQNNIQPLYDQQPPQPSSYGQHPLQPPSYDQRTAQPSSYSQQLPQIPSYDQQPAQRSSYGQQPPQPPPYNQQPTQRAPITSEVATEELSASPPPVSLPPLASPYEPIQQEVLAAGAGGSYDSMGPAKSDSLAPQIYIHPSQSRNEGHTGRSPPSEESQQYLQFGITAGNLTQQVEIEGALGNIGVTTLETTEKVDLITDGDIQRTLSEMDKLDVDVNATLFAEIKNPIPISQLDVTNDTTCNSEDLRALIIENIDGNLNSSKRLIQLAAEAQFGGEFDVICANNDFSYITNTELFCQQTKGDVSCYAYRQI